MKIANFFALRGLTLLSKKDCPLEIGESESFSSWAAFQRYGLKHDLSESNFDIKPVGNGFVLTRVKNDL